MAEIYEEVCKNYSGGRALAEKVMKARYYWPCTLKDTEEFINYML